MVSDKINKLALKPLFYLNFNICSWVTQKDKIDSQKIQELFAKWKETLDRNYNFFRFYFSMGEKKNE
jgi:hypothetical protein